jgi:ABC-type amino acid transport substrate-binding protein
MKRYAVASRSGNTATLQQQGEVVGISPYELVLATNDGFRSFAITPATRQPLDFVTGDYVDVHYRMAQGSGSVGTLASVEDLPQAVKPVTETVASTQPSPALEPMEPIAPAAPLEVAELPPAIAPPVAAPTAGAAATPRTAMKAQRLPQTASDLPLIGLIGVIAVAGSLGLRVLFRA